MAGRSNCSLYATVDEVFLAGPTLQFGKFNYLERCILGSRQEVHYKICGIQYNNKDTTVLCPSSPRQLILQGTSQLSVGVLVSMLKRSLKVVLSSLGCPAVSSSSSRTNVPIFDFACSTDVVVPGAGAGELGWSLLWRQVAILVEKSSSGAVPTENDVPEISSICTKDTQDYSFEEAVGPLVQFIGAALISRLSASHADSLSECAPLLHILSDAYLQVPLQCIINSHDVLSPVVGDVPSCNLSVRQVLLEWQQQFCAAGPSMGRLGLVVNPDPLAK